MHWEVTAGYGSEAAPSVVPLSDAKGGYLGYGPSRESASCGDSRGRFVDS